MTARVAVDMNVRGGTVAGIDDAGGPVAIGDQVLAVDPFDGLVTDGTVLDMDQEKRLLYLAVDWGTFRDDPEAGDDPACE